jgi:tRNA (guanine-N7-)-methyltransferase
VETLSLARAIDQYLIPWTRLDWPLDWERIFERPRSLRVELGFGNGEFLLEAARRHPEINWIGVEISWGSVRRLLARLSLSGRGNVRIIQGDGALALDRLFHPDSVEEVVINHSDPWPKPRHHRRRLIQEAFLDIVAVKLRPGGRVIIVTDHQEYASWITEALRRQARLRSTLPTAWVRELPGYGSTKYKRMGIEAGATIHHFVWQRTRGGEGPPSSRDEVKPMPNVLLEGRCRFGDLFRDFEPQSWCTEHQGGEVRLQLLCAYLRHDGREWLVEARSQEEKFCQHFVLTATRRGDEKILLKLSTIGSPRPTWGVKKTLDHLTRVVLDRNPGLRGHRARERDSGTQA